MAGNRKYKQSSHTKTTQKIFAPTLIYSKSYYKRVLRCSRVQSFLYTHARIENKRLNLI